MYARGEAGTKTTRERHDEWKRALTLEYVMYMIFVVYDRWNIYIFQLKHVLCEIINAFMSVLQMKIGTSKGVTDERKNEWAQRSHNVWHKHLQKCLSKLCTYSGN